MLSTARLTLLILSTYMCHDGFGLTSVTGEPTDGIATTLLAVDARAAGERVMCERAVGEGSIVESGLVCPGIHPQEIQQLLSQELICLRRGVLEVGVVS